jgi:hypothetical protein
LIKHSQGFGSKNSLQEKSQKRKKTLNKKTQVKRMVAAVKGIENFRKAKAPKKQPFFPACSTTSASQVALPISYVNITSYDMRWATE